MVKKKRKGKKKNIWKPVIVTTVSLVILSVIFYYTKIYKSPSFAHYGNFGIDLPVNYNIHGIDVSKYQGRISWELVKEMQANDVKIGFAFIKATEGISNADPEFKRNWRETKRNGITRGAYHFFIASKSGKSQAEQFIDKVKFNSNDLPPVLDVEGNYGASVTTVRKNVAEWLNAVELYYQVKPIIYTNIDFYGTYLAGSFDDYPLWIAHYKVKDQPRIQRTWSFWQHNETGRVNGIDNYVDFNVFNGDSTDFFKLLLQ